MMPETRFTEFPALSVDSRVWIHGLHRIPMTDYFFYLFLQKIEALKKNIYNNVV